MRWFLDLLRPPVRGHICPTQARKRVLQAIAAHCGRDIPITAPDCEFQVAVIEAVDELTMRAESAEAELRHLLAVELGAEPPATMRVTAEMIMRQRIKTKAAQG